MVAAIKPTKIQSIVLKAGMLTDEAIKNGSLRKNTEKRGSGGEPSRDGNVRNDHKRSRTRREFASTTNPVRREYMGVAPKCINYSFYHHLKMHCRTRTNYNRLGNFAKDCMARPRMVTLVNARHPTTTRGACFKCGGQGNGNNGNQTRVGAFMMGANEARQDPNIMTLNDVHDTFYVSNLKKCLAKPTLHVPLEEIQVDTKLNFVEEQVGILEQEFKKLKR
nr:reverse transcriptase domain-containing protein [Tanacetum cinerariifolium]